MCISMAGLCFMLLLNTDCRAIFSQRPTHPGFSFCWPAVYLSKPLKNGFVEKIPACAAVFWRKVLQGEGWVLPVHVQDDSDRCLSYLIYLVLQGAQCKLQRKHLSSATDFLTTKLTSPSTKATQEYPKDMEKKKTRQRGYSRRGSHTPAVLIMCQHTAHKSSTVLCFYY